MSRNAVASQPTVKTGGQRIAELLWQAKPYEPSESIAHWDVYSISLKTGQVQLLWSSLSKDEGLERVRTWNEQTSGMALLPVPLELAERLFSF